MRGFIAFVLLLIACVPTVQVYTETPGHEELLRQAGETVGVRTKLVEAPGRGVITVEFRSNQGTICGRALEKVLAAEGLRDALENGIVDCEPKAWTCPNATFAAHELGHVIGLLKHVGVDRNLMEPAPKDGAQLTEEQKLRVRALAVAFNEVCR